MYININMQSFILGHFLEFQFFEFFCIFGFISRLICMLDFLSLLSFCFKSFVFLSLHLFELNFFLFHPSSYTSFKFLFVMFNCSCVFKITNSLTFVFPLQFFNFCHLFLNLFLISPHL